MSNTSLDSSLGSKFASTSRRIREEGGAGARTTAGTLGCGNLEHEPVKANKGRSILNNIVFVGWL